MDSTESAVVQAAAQGKLPEWAQVSPSRYEHLDRVAALMAGWAELLGLSADERERWVAVAYLHDALRDAEPEELRHEVPETFRDVPGPLLHGPAAAERLRGQVGESVLCAVGYHTIGHPALDRMGRALFLADFLEPGRDFEEAWRASLRARMPEEMDEVLIEVVAARIRHLLSIRKPIRPETAAFWSVITGEA